MAIAPAKEDYGGATSSIPSASRPHSQEKNSCVVVGAHACMLKISRIFGLAPLKFERQSTGFVVTLSHPMCIYSYILVTVLISCAIFGITAEINVGVERSARMPSLMAQAVSACDVLIVIATAGAGVYGAPRRMRMMMLYMESVASVDTSISAQYSATDERRTRGLLLAALALFTALLTDDVFYHSRQARFDRNWDVVRNYAGFYFLWFLVVVLELQFAFTAFSVRSRLRAVNDALACTVTQVSVAQDNTRESQRLNMYAIRVAPNVSLLVDSLATQNQTAVIKKQEDGEPRLAVPPSEAIRRLASLHEALCEVIQHVDNSYGLPLIVILISTLLHLIVTPYYLIIELGKEVALTNRLHFLALQFMWCAFHFCRLLVVVEPCHYTTYEGKRTEELVCRLMTFAPSTGILPSRLELFSRQLLLRSVNYTPLGMCTLDRPLMASIIGAVTTYLVILIQFQSLIRIGFHYRIQFIAGLTRGSFFKSKFTTKAITPKLYPLQTVH